MSADGEKATEPRAMSDWRRVIDENIGKVLGSSFRQQILWILNERIASPSEIALELNATLNRTCHHISMLSKAGCVEQVERRVVGSTVQTFYKATARAYLDDLDWPSVPDTVKAGMRATLLMNILEDAIAVVGEEAFDDQPESHLSWTPMIVDDRGRKELSRIFLRALEEAIEVQDSTKERLADSGAKGFSYTVALMAFPSLAGEKYVAPPVAANDVDAALTSSEAKTRRLAKDDIEREGKAGAHDEEPKSEGNSGS